MSPKKRRIQTRARPKSRRPRPRAAAASKNAAAEAGAPLIIDAHCHTFNASDLSVKGFLSEVVVDSDENVLIRLLDPLVRMLAQAIGKAPGADDERQHLGTIHAAAVARKLGAAETALVAERANRDAEYQANIAHQIDRLSRSSNRQERELYEAILDESGARDLAKGAIASAQTVGPVVAQSLSLSFGPIKRAIDWVGRLRHYRADIISELISTYGSGANGVTLFASAMVDFAAWLGDEPVTEPSAQVALGGLLTRAFPGRIHFLAAFDPWREAKSPGTKDGSLFWVKEAIANHGFIGVKLYPPMGFAAAENATLDFSEVEQTDPKFGQSLDDALDALFSWAAENDVPVMAHCNASEFSKHAFELRASPAFWAKAIAKPANKGLRVNLGHFGGQDNLGSDPSSTKAGHDWPQIILGMIGDGTQNRVYTDIGNFNMHDAGVRQAWFGRLKVALTATPALASRLMYGTDWMMLAMSEGAADYLNQFRQELSAELPDVADAVLGGNARDYFGLNPGDNARARLEGFYDSNNLPRPGWLK